MNRSAVSTLVKWPPVRRKSRKALQIRGKTIIATVCSSSLAGLVLEWMWRSGTRNSSYVVAVCLAETWSDSLPRSLVGIHGDHRRVNGRVISNTVIKSDSGHSLNEILKETIGEGKWRDCRQGVVNPRLSGVFVVLFTRLLRPTAGGSVSPPLGSPGVAWSGECARLFYECNGMSTAAVVGAWFLICYFQDPKQADYDALLTQTNCFKCKVRANTAVGFPWWII